VLVFKIAAPADTVGEIGLLPGFGHIGTNRENARCRVMIIFAAEGLVPLHGDFDRLNQRSK
jgi:hypothetical protein